MRGPSVDKPSKPGRAGYGDLKRETEMETKKSSKKSTTSRSAKPFVVVRTYSAGVHCGNFAGRDGDCVTLTNARRVWRWRGANTLHEVSLRGVDEEYSRISQPVSSITLLQVIEIIPCEPDAIENLSRSRWGK
jgi:hypothetical protein